MISFLKIASILLIAIVVVSCIPYKDKSINLLISVSACVLIIVYIISNISPQIELITRTLSEDMADISLILKIICISILAQFVADIATDTGNKAISNIAIITGKVSILYLTIPIYVNIIETIKQIIK